ncbi:single-stranded DNA-binding protein [Periweissella cryptocerci]|uniref:Single-stranded DNA-binding protein n=1 Tax=Periweissella cryptocerci TaxID=2506420 RepID=A0A4P6YS18_9LACO|nr:ERF family protein [Periweissella cryptocerci]QBO35412.1 single-stranded DNA-binding protein [Periweissella cryptocerci]
MKELAQIQQNVKVPKAQNNTFGKYKYRNAEDILRAVKPALAEAKAVINLSDDVVLIGERYYIKATATITNSEGETASSTAFAREPLAKKGMDESQITGSASSYARKYALSGLLGIDDTDDPDSMDNRQNNAVNKVDPLAQALMDNKQRYTKISQITGMGINDVGKQAMLDYEQETGKKFNKHALGDVKTMGLLLDKKIRARQQESNPVPIA